MLILLAVLLSVAFFTLVERKMLSLSQMRLGPNKSFYQGLIQPVLDGLKLLKKLNVINIKSQLLLYWSMSIVVFMISLLIWSSIPFYVWDKKLLILFWILLLFGLSAFMVLLLGWGSLSKFGILGGNRSVVQVVSFEINFTLTIFIPFAMTYSMSYKLFLLSKSMYFLWFLLALVLMVIETQRAPVDLSEGESELVSGYNTEFNSVLFTMVFLAEYSNMISLLLFVMVMNNNLSFYKMFVIFSMMLLLRSCYPRLRYNNFMEIMWLWLAPISIIVCFTVLILSFY